MSPDRNRDIEFVYFDLGNVLLAFDPELACRNIARIAGVTEARARDAVYHSGLQDRFEHGEVDGNQYAEAVRDQLGKSKAEVDSSAILDAVSDMFTPIESMGAVMREVRRNGYRVGLLSNTCHAHWDWIQRQQYAVMDFDFEVTILSFEVGSMKPDEAIYVAAEQAAGVQGTQILFLDDKEENVAAASARRWKAARCLGGEQAVRALQEFRILDESG